MRKSPLFSIMLGISSVMYMTSCTKTESDFSTNLEKITLSADAVNIIAGNTVILTVRSNINNDVTSQCKFYINDTLIGNNSVSFQRTGSFSVIARKGEIISNKVVIQVSAAANVSNGSKYVHKVLVEEYSGTWCGNCPRILYGVELLHKQTNKAIVAGFHLFGNDPYVTSIGNEAAVAQGISGVPTGKFNRVNSWNGPEYENVNQIISAIQAYSSTGLAINSSVSNNKINITVKVNHAQPVQGGAKLTVYLVEDSLFYTQRNYSSNLYGGQANISNFRYDGVIRTIVSSISGDDIPASGTDLQKNYSINLPTNIINSSKVRLIFFVTDGAGIVVNTQDAKLGENKDFEKL